MCLSFVTLFKILQFLQYLHNFSVSSLQVHSRSFNFFQVFQVLSSVWRVSGGCLKVVWTVSSWVSRGHLGKFSDFLKGFLKDIIWQGQEYKVCLLLANFPLLCRPYMREVGFRTHGLFCWILFSLGLSWTLNLPSTTTHHHPPPGTFQWHSRRLRFGM